jgi:acetyl-CoA acyltransferase
MRDVAVVGAYMTKFGKFLDRSLKDLSGEAVVGALEIAGIEKSQVEVAVVGNAVAGLITGQEMIRGQVVLRELGIGGIPIINTENACASSSTAFHVASMYVASGMYEIALALGMEKLYHEDKRRSFQALGTAVDVESRQQLEARAQARETANWESSVTPTPAKGAGETRSMFMDVYASFARQHMEKFGTTARQFARVAEKNHFHGSLNPKAQYREVYSIEDILASPTIADPLTRLMCSPIGDGAAAAVLCAATTARRLTSSPVYVRASVLGSGMERAPGDPDTVTRIARSAYEMAGIGPEDLSLVECHDGSAPAELIHYEELGLCGLGEGGRLIDDKATYFDGRIPVNTSGGLIARGHPIGATGIAQIYEIWTQLRGEAGPRQVRNPKVGLTHNSGGMVKGESAAVSVHLFSL